jgi:hypothetical protein
MIALSWPDAFKITGFLLCSTLFLSGCSTEKVYTSQAFNIGQNQQIVPVLPFTNTLVPNAFSEAVFNDFVDNLNESKTSGFSGFAIIKEDLKEVERILSPSHIYISGEIWSYIENSGCCSTELRVKSRLRIFRVLSRELLWEAEIPLESFFEHDVTTLAAEQEKLEKRLSAAMTTATLKALQGAKRIVVE